MARDLVRLVVAAAVAFGSALMIAIPAQAETCVNAMPSAARDVSGDTFEGEILSITPGPEIEPGMPRLSDVRVAISKVYADASHRPEDDLIREGETIQIHSNACDGFASVGVAVGSSVLISTANRYSASTWDTAVWERRGSTLRLLVLLGPNGEEVWLTEDRRLAAVRTVPDALALVAPGALGMPDTATEPHRPSVIGPRLAMVFGTVTFVLVVLGRTSRRPEQSRQESRP
jgi:hypothetical protein